MPNSCAAYGCKNKQGDRSCSGQNISFFKFPLDRPLVLKKWIRNLTRDNFVPSKFSRLCSLHFLESDFEYENFTNRRLLKKDSVPTLFCQPQQTRRWRKILPNLKSNEMNSNENGNLSDDVYHSSSTERRVTDTTWVDKPRVFIITCKPANDTEGKQAEAEDVKVLESPPIYPQQVPAQSMEQPTQSSSCRKRKSDLLHEDYEEAAERRHREKMQRWDRLIDIMEELVDKI